MASIEQTTSPRQLTRVEAYSDGVFAIAATLLILEIEVPSLGIEAAPAELWRELAGLWPSYLAFLLSFGTILVMWVSHHHAIRLLVGISNPFLYANGFLLLTIVFLPFPTAVLATYITTELASAAVVFFAAANLLTSLGFMLWFWSMQHPIYLLRPEVGRARVTRVWAQTLWGTLAYVIAAAIGWWWPMVGLGIMIALSILWITMSLEQAHYVIPVD